MGARPAVRGYRHDENRGRLAVEGAEIHAGALDAEGGDQAVHAVGLAVGNGDAVLHAGAHALFALGDGAQDGFAVADVPGGHQQIHHLGQDFILGGALEVEADRFHR